MNTGASQLPDISRYLVLIDDFTTSQITAAVFQSLFLRAMKSERRILGEPIYPLLQELFEDADAYVSRPELRTEPDDLDENQLLECALRTRQALRDLGFH